MKYILPTVTALAVGIVILASYLVPDNVALLTSRIIFVDWAVVLAGLAVLLGVFNVVIINARRVQASARGWPYNLLTILAVIVMLTVGVGEGLVNGQPALYESGTLSNALFSGVIVASQAALASMVMFFLVAGAMRMMRTRPSTWTLLFLGVVVIVLVGWVFIPLAAVRQWLIDVVALGGARGIMLGVAIGTIVMGLRVLTGSEQPYRD